MRGHHTPYEVPPGRQGELQRAVRLTLVARQRRVHRHEVVHLAAPRRQRLEVRDERLREVRLPRQPGRLWGTGPGGRTLQMRRAVLTKVSSLTWESRARYGGVYAMGCAVATHPPTASRIPAWHFSFPTQTKQINHTFLKRLRLGTGENWGQSSGKGWGWGIFFGVDDLRH